VETPPLPPYEYLTISRQGHIALKSAANYWQTAHRKAVDRFKWRELRYQRILRELKTIGTKSNASSQTELSWNWQRAKSAICKVGYSLASANRAILNVQGRNTLVASTCSTSPIGDTVRARRVPSHANHQAAVMPQVGWPPVMGVRHHGMQVFDDCLEIE
jgi:hypothetical protein